MEIEHELLYEEVQIPVYLAHESEQLNTIYEDIKVSGNTDSAKSAFEGLKYIYF